MDETPIDLDVNDFVEKPDEVESQETTAPEPSPEENKAPEVVDDGFDTPVKEEVESDKETEDKPVEDKSDAEPVEETKEEDKPLGKADERKAKLNTEIRDLVATRNAIKQEVETLNSNAYQPQTVEELVDQGMDESQARVAALEQRIELSEYNNRVAEAQLSISHESEKVLSEFPMFNPESDQFKPEIAQQAAQLFDRNLQKDPNTGQIIGSNVSPYALYKTIADAYTAAAQESEIKGQQAAEKELAAVETPSSAPPKAEKKDNFLEAFNSV